MAITSWFEGALFDSREAAVMAAAFEEVINRLSIARGSDPVREELIRVKLLLPPSGALWINDVSCVRR
jgi:hypothetical protein